MTWAEYGCAELCGLCGDPLHLGSQSVQQCGHKVHAYCITRWPVVTGCGHDIEDEKCGAPRYDAQGQRVEVTE